MTTQVTIHVPVGSKDTVEVREQNYSPNGDIWLHAGVAILQKGETRHYHVWDNRRLVIRETENPIESL
jgi:hypothetical protein